MNNPNVKVWDMWNEDHKYGCKGYEWTHIDEYGYKVDNELINPVMSCVLYGEHNDPEGGYLEVKNYPRD